MRLNGLRWCLLVWLPLAGGMAAAPASEVLDRGRLEVGVGLFALDGRVQVDGSGEVEGTAFRLKRDLDLGGRDSSRLAALSWRPFEHDEFAFRVRRLSRNGERVIARDLVYDGETFPINSRVRGELDLDLVSLSYTRWLLVREDRAFGLSVGGLQYRLGLSLAADNLPGGIQPEPLRVRTREDLPVLVLGAEYRQSLGPRLRGVLRAAAFEADVGRVDGWIYEFDASLEYALGEHALLALSVVDTQLDAQSRREQLFGSLRLELLGAQAALRWRW